MRLSDHAITVDLPPRWEGAFDTAPPAPGRRMSSGATTPVVASLPTLHLATFPLPRVRGDFGSGAVELMRTTDGFVSLLEYGPECVGTPLFSQRGLPRSIHGRDLSARALQRTLKGQAGTQVFFTEAGRAFCLYVVVGDAGQADRTAREVSRALSAITIGPTS